MDRPNESLKEIRLWIAARHEGMDQSTLDLDLDLIEHRLIDSLDFAEFLFVLEEIAGRTIDLGTVDLDTFRTLRTIQARFLDTHVDA
ncbi:hypothetical protein [Ideonella sp. A 288]|uniref:hypothetical protein n=1 Tax=Ideonella sp. A 288 TaxID=1962181 RepID=UPI0018FE27CE|nr:hypothetical protein [Ideonella sp. A 288]